MMNLDESHMIEFMVCSLINDSMDKGLQRALHTNTPKGVAENSSIKSRKTIEQLWIGFMVDGYRDSISPSRKD